MIKESDSTRLWSNNVYNTSCIYNDDDIFYAAHAQSNNTRVALMSPPIPSSAVTTTNLGNNTTTFNLEVNGKSYPIFLACFIYCWS
jgi:hypothetical protein